MAGVGSHLYAGGGIGLGLSQINPHLAAMQNQTHPPADLLRLGASSSSGPGAPFGHLISSSHHPSSFRPPHPPPSAAFFLGAGNSGSDFCSDDTHPHQSFLQNKPYQGLMQLPDLQPNSTGSPAADVGNPFNVSFYSNGSSTSGSAGNHAVQHHLMMHDQFTSGNAGASEPPGLYDSTGGGMSSLFNPSLQNDSILPQMSATALLQKAAQMGSTSSNNSLSGGIGAGGSGGGGGAFFLRGLGSSSSSSPKPASFSDHRALRSQAESHEKQLQDIMNSFADGNSGVFSGGRTEQEAKFRHFDNTGFCNMDEAGYHGNSLTRDFLGVGSMLRSMGGGVASQGEQHRGVIDIEALDSEIKPSSSGRPFAGGGSLP